MRRAVLAPLAFGYLLMVCGTTAAPDSLLPNAQTLRARMAAAAGPANTNYRETIVGTGNGGPTVTVRAHRGDDEVVTFARGRIHTSYGTHRGTDWHQTANGIVVPDVRDPGLAAPLKTTTTVRRSWSPLDAYVISELDGGGYGQRDFVDSHSYLLLRHDEIGPAGTATTTYANYARFGTEMLPSSWRVTDHAFSETTACVRTQFAAGRASEADVAEPPLRRFVSLPG